MRDGVSSVHPFGGDEGGVSSPWPGTGPGGHIGMCLFGTAVGVPREDVFRVRCGAGVVERPARGSARATTVAIVE